MRTTLSILLVSLFLATLLGCKPKQKVPVAKATFLPRLTALAADPKGQKPSSTDVKTDKTATLYGYSDAPPLRSVTVITSKERPDALRIRFDSDEKVSAESFGTPKYSSNLPDGWFEIGDGPLAGKLLHFREDPKSIDVLTPTFVLTTSFNFDDRRAMRWACESGRGGVKAIDVDNFTTTCRDAVQKRLTRPDTADFHYLGVNNDVRVSKDCEYQWTSDVTAKNAFNAEMKHNFRCSYSPKTGLVESSID